MGKLDHRVSDSYDRIAEWFDEHRSCEIFEKPYLDKMAQLLKPEERRS